MDPDLTERGLTRCLAERGYVIGKYAVGKLKEELLKEWQPETGIWENRRRNSGWEPLFFKGDRLCGKYEKPDQAGTGKRILYPPKGLHCLLTVLPA